MKRLKRSWIIGLLSVSTLLVSCSSESVNEASVDDQQQTDQQTSSSETQNQTSDEKAIFENAIFESGNILRLVNKSYPLEEGYEPSDLKTIEVPTVNQTVEANMMREEAADQLKKLFDAALEDGIQLYANSGYRSYNVQKITYEHFVQSHGEAEAKKFSAQPGYSEHQTGLAMDVTSASAGYGLTQAFGQTPEGIWVKDNAYKFGFIIRYLEGKEDITGYMYEPWHIRYVGEEAAQLIHDSGVTYEEYLESLGITL